MEQKASTPNVSCPEAVAKLPLMDALLSCYFPEPHVRVWQIFTVYFGDGFETFPHKEHGTICFKY